MGGIFSRLLAGAADREPDPSSQGYSQGRGGVTRVHAPGAMLYGQFVPRVYESPSRRSPSWQALRERLRTSTSRWRTSSR